jgi:hypothetical protein
MEIPTTVEVNRLIILEFKHNQLIINSNIKKPILQYTALIITTRCKKNLVKLEKFITP